MASGFLTEPYVKLSVSGHKAAKSVGYDFSGVDVPSDGGLMSLRYSEFVVPLVKAVQEQQQLITDQQKTINSQQNIISDLQKTANDLLIRVEKLEHK